MESPETGGVHGDKTHAITTSNRRPPTAIEKLQTTLAGDPLRKITAYYDGNPEAAAAFAASAIEYVRKVPKLIQCDPTSLIMAFVTAAQFKFMPSSVSGEAYIIPYGDEAKFQIGYQGYVTLLYRSRKVKSISANIVYANDHFEYQEGLDPKLEHKPVLNGPKGDPIAVYTVVELAGGGRSFKVMSRDDVMAIKNTSKAKNKSDSPWNTGDPLLAMWKKTCLIQHQKFLPKTADIRRALEIDYEGEGMERPMLDAGGPAVAKAYHDPAKAVAALPVQDEQPLCPAGKHRGRMSDDGADCNACLEDALAEPPPAQQPDIQVGE